MREDKSSKKEKKNPLFSRRNRSASRSNDSIERPLSDQSNNYRLYHTLHTPTIANIVVRPDWFYHSVHHYCFSFFDNQWRRSSLSISLYLTLSVCLYLYLSLTLSLSLHPSLSHSFSFSPAKIRFATHRDSRRSAQCAKRCLERKKARKKWRKKFKLVVNKTYHRTARSSVCVRKAMLTNFLLPPGWWWMRGSFFDIMMHRDDCVCRNIFYYRG